VSDSTEGQQPAADLAAALREERLRARLTRRELADLASIHQSVLSRLERGTYPHEITTATLKRLSDALDCDNRLFAAARVASPAAMELLAHLGRAHSRAGEVQVRLGLRRLELAGIAGEFETQAMSPDDTRIDTKRLCLEVARSRRRPVEPRFGKKEAVLAVRRFWRAHAAAHTLLETVCRWPYVEQTEVDANSLAGMLIAPTRLVNSAIRSAVLPAEHEIWEPGCADLVRAVAERLAIPGWVALRRIADAELDFFLPLDEEM
jgi:transcriptional regulator with XRE-family HTH domain